MANKRATEDLENRKIVEGLFKERLPVRFELWTEFYFALMELVRRNRIKYTTFQEVLKARRERRENWRKSVKDSRALQLAGTHSGYFDRMTDIRGFLSQAKWKQGRNEANGYYGDEVQHVVVRPIVVATRGINRNLHTYYGGYEIEEYDTLFIDLTTPFKSSEAAIKTLKDMEANCSYYVDVTGYIDDENLDNLNDAVIHAHHIAEKNAEDMRNHDELFGWEEDIENLHDEMKDNRSQILETFTQLKVLNAEEKAGREPNPALRKVLLRQVETDLEERSELRVKIADAREKISDLKSYMERS